MKLSIVTVCYNPPLDSLKKTVESVVSNMRLALVDDENELEYIIIDGGSSISILSYLNQEVCALTDLNVELISESDEGIYDAMNKGIIKSNHDWIIFMNAGDTFATVDTLTKISCFLEKDCCVLYGDMLCNGKLFKAHPLSYIERGIIMACHQSMFFNRKLLGDSLIYDDSYKVYSDYELVVRICKVFPLGLKYVDIPISNYEGGGISDKISYQKRKDKYKILFRYYGVAGILKAIFHWLETRIK